MREKILKILFDRLNDFLTKTDGEKVNTYLINGLAKHLIEDVNDFFKDLSKKDAKE